ELLAPIHQLSPKRVQRLVLPRSLGFGVRDALRQRVALVLDLLQSRLRLVACVANRLELVRAALIQLGEPRLRRPSGLLQRFALARDGLDRAALALQLLDPRDELGPRPLDLPDLAAVLVEIPLQLMRSLAMRLRLAVRVGDSLPLLGANALQLLGALPELDARPPRGLGCLPLLPERSHELLRAPLVLGICLACRLHRLAMLALTLGHVRRRCRS